LLPTSDDLTRLAHELGFSSHSHFSNAFHRWSGRTPSAFRAAARKPVMLD
jgi:AraC family transcriptional regulator